MHNERLPTASSENDRQDLMQNAYYAYLDEISRYKLLTQDEEISLFMRIQDGDSVARDLFIKSNLRLVVSQARKYYIPGNNQLFDLIQDGNVGLLKAIEQYDPLRGYKFSTYAVYHINKAIQAGSCRTIIPVNIPQQKLSLIFAIRNALDVLEIVSGFKSSPEELAKFLNVPVHHVQAVLPFVFYPVSLNSPFEDGASDKTPIDVFDEYYNNDADDTEKAFIINETRKEIERIIKEALGEKEAYILLSRWGIAGRAIKDVATLAEELKMSHQGIRQSEARSLIKLKKYFASMNLSLSDFS